MSLSIVEALTQLAKRIEPDRKNAAIINDMFEAADDWKNFGRLMMDYPAEQGYNVSGRTQQESELFDELQAAYGPQIKANANYTKIREYGSQLIAAGRLLKPHPDGVYGSHRVARQLFGFLTTEYGLKPGYNGDLLGYASADVYVGLRFATTFRSEVEIRQLPRPSDSYSLEELLFMGGRSVSLTLPPGQTIENEADVRAWLTTVAAILQEYGADVLANRAGAFDRLAAASAERDRLIIEENDRLYGAQQPEPE